MKKFNKEFKKIDWLVTLLPLITIILLCFLFVLNPNNSNKILSKIRFFFGDTFGSFYLIIGLSIFIISLVLAFSKYGKIVLGKKDEKPKYSFFAWGSMMFTCGLAADIIFYSFSEWFMYAKDPYLNSLGQAKDWAGVFPLFHWSLIPWAFYLVLAVAFGIMLHIRKNKRQRISEACRPILGKHTDGWLGRLIDLIAVFALIAGTATTFSVATPLMAAIINTIFKINLNEITITIIILIITCITYTYSLLHGFKGINFLAKGCIYLFFGLLGYVLFFGGQTRFIIEEGISSLGKMFQNFIGLATYTDPLRENFFPQNWTIYYWAYWMVWCVAAPFFIGNISKGRTIKQVILGGYLYGGGATILSFIILGNYSMGLELSNLSNFMDIFTQSGNTYELIISIVKTLPFEVFVLALILITMILFYATSFDSIALTASCYSYHKLNENEHPHKLIQLMWCILLIILPIGLVFAKSSMSNLQSVSIIAAFPIGVIMILIVLSMFKELKKIQK